MTTLRELRESVQLRESQEEISKLLSKHGLKVDKLEKTSSGHVHVNVTADDLHQKEANKTLADAGYKNHFVVHSPQKITTGGEWNAGKPSRAGQWAGD